MFLVVEGQRIGERREESDVPVVETYTVAPLFL